MTDLQNFITNGFVLKKGLFSKQEIDKLNQYIDIRQDKDCLLYTSPSPRDRIRSRMPSSA